jgi:hypothetical protein
VIGDLFDVIVLGLLTLVGAGAAVCAFCFFVAGGVVVIKEALRGTGGSK